MYVCYCLLCVCVCVCVCGCGCGCGCVDVDVWMCENAQYLFVSLHQQLQKRYTHCLRLDFTCNKAYTLTIYSATSAKPDEYITHVFECNSAANAELYCMLFDQREKESERERGRESEAGRARDR